MIKIIWTQGMMGIRMFHLVFLFIFTTLLHFIYIEDIT